LSWISGADASRRRNLFCDLLKKANSLLKRPPTAITLAVLDASVSYYTNTLLRQFKRKRQINRVSFNASMSARASRSARTSAIANAPAPHISPQGGPVGGLFVRRRQDKSRRRDGRWRPSRGKVRPLTWGCPDAPSPRRRARPWVDASAAYGEAARGTWGIRHAGRRRASLRDGGADANVIAYAAPNTIGRRRRARRHDGHIGRLAPRGRALDGLFYLAGVRDLGAFAMPAAGGLPYALTRPPSMSSLS
jgi:hypothetical protein